MVKIRFKLVYLVCSNGLFTIKNPIRTLFKRAGTDLFINIKNFKMKSFAVAALCASFALGKKKAGERAMVGTNIGGW